LPTATKTLARPPRWESPASKPLTPTLRFNAYAWAKFNYLRDLDESEVFCFGITDPDDPMLVTDLWLPKQEVTSASAEIDEDDLAKRIEDMATRAPISSFLRIWLHTHPGNSATPSSVDRDTQETIFAGCEWSVMAILAKGGEFHCELAWWGPDKKSQLRVKIPHMVDWHLPFEGADPDRWSADYIENVTSRNWLLSSSSSSSSYSKPSLFPPNERMGGELTSEERQELMYLSEMWHNNDPDMSDEMIERLEELELNSNELAYCTDFDDDTNGYPDHKHWAGL
jgi:hypothetical protein